MNSAFRWHGNHFIDDANGSVLASYDDTILEVALRRLNLTPPTTVGKWQLVATDGDQRWVAQLKSMTVSRLVVTTPAGNYGLKRDSVFSPLRSITDAKNRVLGTTRPRINTDLEVKLTTGAEVDLVDLAFMTYALTLIDTANRRVKG